MGHQPARSLPREGTLMRRTGIGPRGLALLVLLALGVAVEAAAQGPAVGGWATYEWRSAAKVDVPVLVQQPGASGAAELVGRSRGLFAPPDLRHLLGRPRRRQELRAPDRHATDGRWQPPLGHPGHGGPRVGQGPEERHPGQEGRDPHPGERSPAAPPGGRPGRAGGGHRAGRAASPPSRRPTGTAPCGCPIRCRRSASSRAPSRTVSSSWSRAGTGGAQDLLRS